MPEGDTIHKLAAVLRRELDDAGRLVEARIEGRPVTGLAGRPVDEVFALGKHLFVVVGPLALRTHLGMTGSWHRYARGETWRRPRWMASALLATGDADLVCFRAKEVELLDCRSLRYRDFLRRLGPDLLAPSFDAAVAIGRARSILEPRTEMCDVLLDQRVAAGIGNVYKSEVLFLESLHPRRTIGEVPDEALAACYARARSLLARNLGPGPRRTRATRAHAIGRTRDADAPELWVYRRRGEPCARCDRGIAYALLGRDRRSTYWCESCQPRSARG